MTLARLNTARGLVYDVLGFTGDAEWVLRDPHGDVRLFEDCSLRERVEVRCDKCGTWTTSVEPIGAGWACVPECEVMPPIDS